MIGRAVAITLQIAAAFLFGICQYAQPAAAQEIWLSPRGVTTADFMDMFNPGAPWRTVASHVRVFEIGGAAQLPDGVLHRIAQGLRDRNIALGAGLGPLTSADWARCGVHVEGYAAKAQAVHDATRLKAAGINVDYFGMDEPLWFGHRFSGRNACHSSLAEVVADVAEKVRQVKTVYPHAQIGDVEPVAGLKGIDWADDLEHWFDAYQAATGEKLAYFRADIQWNTPWQEPMRRLSAILQSRGIPLQIIYNGDARSDAEWTDQAMQRAREYEVVAKLPIDVPVFQCWMPNPTRDLPESDPTTLTGLALRYIRWKQGK